MSESPVTARALPTDHIQLSPTDRLQAAQFRDRNPRHELRRVVAEGLGTYLLVVVGIGSGVVDSLTHGGVGHAAAAVAPGLTVMAIILVLGANSGAHLNPVVTLAFAIRADFRWNRVIGYMLAQTAGATAAALTIRLVLGVGAGSGVTTPGPGFSPVQALATEALLTFGLVSVVLGAASGAQNIGPLSAIAAGGYVAAAGLWAGPVSGASMNPARSIGPALVSGQLTDLWIYLVGPLAGALLACVFARILRGPAGDAVAKRAASGAP